MKVDIIDAEGKLIETAIIGDEDSDTARTELEQWCEARAMRIKSESFSGGDLISWAQVIAADDWAKSHA